MDRVTELQAEHKNRHNITIDSLTERLTTSEQLGLEINNPTAAVAAIKVIATIHGLITNKQEVTSNFDLRR